MSLHSDLNQSAQQTGRYQKQLESTITFNVKMLLTAYGYSQSSLAEAMGIGRSAMSLKMSGKTGWSVYDLVNASRFLKVSTEQLLDDSLMRRMGVSDDAEADMEKSAVSGGLSDDVTPRRSAPPRRHSKTSTRSPTTTGVPDARSST
ncbi:helix-turn-helix transcriptional regulator [Bifidobacterium sp. WCA-178-WT-4B]|nr:helix-turn-helix transcriptional regulator [Bifidobacterium sp. WCA-178-WT-4B]